MATVQVNGLSEEVSDLALGNIGILCSVEEDTVVERHGLDAVNDVVEELYWFLFDAFHGLLLEESTVLLVSLADGWHGVVIVLSCLFAGGLHIDDTDLTFN